MNQPTPERIFDTITAYQRSAAIKSAIELDLFTAIGEGANTPQLLSGRCKASERGLRILADYLAALGLLTKSGSGYELTSESASFLDRRARAYLGSTVAFLLHPAMTGQFGNLTEAVRKGGTVVEQGTISPENPIWVDFARSMMPMMFPPAQFIAELTGAAKGEEWKVLDIAAGHGIFGITLAQRNPNAEIVALDWPAVLDVAETNARNFGVSSRYQTLPGDALTLDFGNNYDLVLVTNFLHHFDVPTCENFMRKVRRALKPSGRAITLEFVPNDDRVSPPTAAMFGLSMLVGTPAGDVYTYRELEQMFSNAGFNRSELHPVPMSPQHLIISYA
jgi:SAM-dependent methyltransferase